MKQLQVVVLAKHSSMKRFGIGRYRGSQGSDVENGKDSVRSNQRADGVADPSIMLSCWRWWWLLLSTTYGEVICAGDVLIQYRHGSGVSMLPLELFDSDELWSCMSGGDIKCRCSCPSTSEVGDVVQSVSGKCEAGSSMPAFSGGGE